MNRRPGTGKILGLKTTRSFTLVEILVSIAILSILTFVLLTMLGSLTTIWQQGQAHNERRTVAQAVLDRMSRDLSMAVFPASRTMTNGLQMVINPTGVTSTYLYPYAIFCQAPVGTDSVSQGNYQGNLAIVGYFIQWLNGTPGTPTLSRLLINPSSANYGIYTSPNAWVGNSILAANAPSAFVSASANNNYAGLLAENVLALWVQALDPSGNPIQQTLPTGETFDSRYTYTYTNTPPNNQSALEVPVTGISAGPASLRIAVAVMDSRTAKQLTAKPTYTTTYPPTATSFWSDIQTFYNSLPAIIQKGTEIQSTTVNLANAPR